MTVFRNVVFVAALAGLVAGLLMAAMQQFTTTPLILQAETYEGAGEEEEVADATDGHAHEHDEDGWMPEDGFERYFYTALSNVVGAIGFALVLVAFSELAGGIAGWRQGLLWGLGGFAVFTLAPGLGLPPELPMMPAADLAARQVWWIGTVVATAAGLGLIFFRSSLPLAALGILLIVVPHVVGAPHPDTHDSPIPANLHHSFVVAVTVTNLVFWVVLGALVGFFRERIAVPADGTQPSLA